MLSLEDIGAMKLHAIVQNGARLKDFVDISYLLEHKPLEELLKVYEAKYPESNRHLAQHALLYHSDINFSFKVNLIRGEMDWKKIDQRLREAVANPGKTFKNDIRTNQKKSKELKQKQDKAQHPGERHRKGRRPGL